MVNIPASLSSKRGVVSKPPTVTEQRKIKKYGSLEAAKKYESDVASAKQLEKEINEELESVGLDSVSNQADYAAKYSQLSERTKKYIDTPTQFGKKLKEQKTKIISENKIKIEKEIAKYQKERQDSIKYYQEKIKKKREKNQDYEKYENKLDEREEYYKGLIEGLQKGIGKATTYDSIIAYARDLGGYQRDKEAARNQRQRFERDSPTIEVTTTAPKIVSLSEGKTKIAQSTRPQPLYADIDDINNYVGGPAKVYRDVEKTKPVTLQPTATIARPVEKKEALYVDIEDVNLDKPVPIFIKKDDKYVKVDKKKVDITPGVQPIIRKDFLDPSRRKTQLQVVRDTFKVPGLEKVDTRVSTSVANKLLKEGKVTLSNGLVVATPAYAKANPSTKAVWVVSAKNIDSVRNELTYASSVNIFDSPMPWEGAGTFETNQAQINLRKKEYKLYLAAKKELEGEIKKFEEDPEGYKGALGQSTKEGTVFTLDKKTIESLPARQKLIQFSKDIESEYQKSQKEAREMRLTSPIGDFWLKQKYGARNVRLTVGSGVDTLQKTGLGFVGFFATLPAYGSVMLADESGEFKKPEFWREGSLGRKVLDTPTTPSLSGFKYTSPTTYGKFGAYAKEWINRPEAVTQFTTTTGLLTYGAGSLYESFKLERAANIQTFIKQTGKAPTAAQLKTLETAARRTVLGETVSSISPIKIQPGLVGVSTTTSKSAIKAYNKDTKGFTKIDVVGDITGLPEKPTMISPKSQVIKSKSTIPDETFFGTTGTPGEFVTKKIVTGSEKVVSYGSIKYDLFGVSPKITAIPLKNVQIVEIFPYSVSFPQGKSTTRTSYLQKTTTLQERPYQFSKYDLGTYKTKTVFTEKLNAISKVVGEQGDNLFVKSKIWSTPKTSNLEVTMRDLGTGDVSYKFKKGVGPVKTTTGGDMITVSKEIKVPSKTNLIGTTYSKVDVSGKGFKEVESFDIWGRTITDPLGKPTKGVVIPYKYKSITYGPSRVSTSKGVTASFIPEKYLMGSSSTGGGTGIKPSGGFDIGSVGVSPFASGRFESFNAPILSETILAPGTSPLSLSNQALGLGLSSALSSSQSTSLSTSPIQLTSTASTTVPISSTSTSTASSTSTAKSTSSATSSATATSTITTPLTTPIITPTTRPLTEPVIEPIIQRPSIRIPRIPLIIDIEYGGRSYKAEQPYYGEVKVGGKYKKVTTKPHTKSAAKDVIARIIDNTTSAQGRVVKMKSKPTKKIQRGDDYYKRNKDKFRGFKIIKGKRQNVENTIIEKRNRRSDTSGEKSGLGVAQYMSQGKLGRPRKSRPFIL